MEGFRGRLLVRAAEGTLLAAEEFQAPPILQTGLTDARYRHTLFTRPGSPQILRGTIHIECLPEAVRRLSLAIRLLPLKGDSPLAEQKPRVEKTEIPFALDVTALRPDRFRLLVSLSAGSSEIASEMVPLTFREDNVGIVRVDGNNKLVVGGEPFFPYGVYGGVPADELPRIKAAGCNMVLTYDSNPDSLRTLLAKAQEVGLRVVVAAPSPFVGKLPAEADNLREVVRSLRRAPALLGWYLDDEPDGKGTDPALVRAVHDVVVEEDPDHPTWVVFDHPAVYDRYADVCDVFMVDPYPILDKRQPLTKVADWIETARRAVADGKPVIGVPQAFGWEIIKNVPKANYVTPTAEEYRAMVYLSLAHGAKGLVAYCYHVYTEHDAAKSWPWVLGGYLPDKQPKLWDEMTRLAGEVKALTPALLSADREPLSIAQFGDAAEHGVRLRAGGKEVTILVNPGEQPLPLTRAARVMGSALFLAPGTPAAPAGETLPRYGVLVTEAPAR